MKLWQAIVAALCWMLLILMAFTLGEISAEPEKQRVHYIVVPSTNHGEWECR